MFEYQLGACTLAFARLIHSVISLGLWFVLLMSGILGYFPMCYNDFAENFA